MSLSTDLAKQFAKATNDSKKQVTPEVTHKGTIVRYNGKDYVQLDGSEVLTPITKTAAVKPDERVTVVIKNHSATVTGNISSPAARTDDVADVDKKVTELYSVVADKATIKELEAQVARIDTLTADNVSVKEKLTAAEADIDDLQAGNATITGKLTAAEAAIDNLKATKIDAKVVETNYALIKDLDATNANVNNLSATYAEFEKTTTNKLTANEASIKDLEANKLSATQADLKYANIDFSNINQAAVEKLFTDSGIIKDLIVSEGKITGELVGVTIKGDLIEGGTVIADKLVVKGENGLYYKLNTDGVTTETEQTEYNSLNGSVITAKSITATKISVDDLVAFGATIGGFNITDRAIYSGVKDSVNNTTRGIYFDKFGRLAIGDANNYIKYYMDDDSTWKLAISAQSVKMSSSGKDIETLVNSAIVRSVEQFYLSDSPTSLIGGRWSTTVPELTKGKYIWRRTVIMYADGSSEYTPNQNGVCLGGAGSEGEAGRGISSIDTTYQVSASGSDAPESGWTTSIPTTSAEKPYLWTRTIITYTDNTNSTLYSVGSTPDGISIGGRNYILNSALQQAMLDAYDSGESGWACPIGAANASIDNTVTHNGHNTLHKQCTYADDDTWYESNYYFAGKNRIQFTANETWTLSLWIYAKTIPAEPLLSSIRLFDGNWTWAKKVSEISIGDVVVTKVEKWTRIELTFNTPSSIPTYDRGYVMFTTNQTADCYMTEFKLEKGNNATDWTPAPEDAESKIQNAQDAADKAQNTANNSLTSVEQARSDLEILRHSIASLVTDSNGTSLMTQTSDGFTFNIGSIQSNLSDTMHSLDSIKGDIASANNVIKSLDSLTSDLAAKTAYIVMKQDEAGDPCIELGKEDNPFKVRITNTSIDFMEGSQKIAYITNHSLYIQSSVVTDELQIGESPGWVWKKRENGNLGLRWKA